MNKPMSPAATPACNASEPSVADTVCVVCNSSVIGKAPYRYIPAARRVGRQRLYQGLRGLDALALQRRRPELEPLRLLLGLGVDLGEHHCGVGGVLVARRGRDVETDRVFELLALVVGR